MSNTNGNTPVQGETCGEPLENHVIELMTAMAVIGMGGACQDTYRALVEVADYLKAQHHYEAYQSQGIVASELKKAQFQQEVARQQQLGTGKKQITH